mmetsp:Transcript_4049/g.5683  ORF Transcript_4049/g.5683 Transcript_4049/m.5683 type:complete len:241 (-) Transcript_4049:396-1118(-)|eukprot:CAMPEP_0197286742 /NCGR_PEP_ID=MMETSP0890-20130614/2369_1 /TAXON_ID=44058 ORGANISM="Aureoumbra lagunensis, Strain CCMP1510" /NCGR_SAMPLE_ID=MMETSP0890 /ASSEMBLY_ACC=CAM_ASM_000533 /LENGTH=240 /DNA_ID=CAMNT_0042755427 /DNA_START=31 /DNA_END=753 /DNA_ORIENTATION=-
MGLAASSPVSKVSAEGPISLYYFPIEGAGEKVRLAFVLSGIDFENVKVTSDEWSTLKKKTRYGQLPMLRVGANSEEMYQSDAMMKYAALASITNKDLYPTNNPEKIIRIEEIMGLLDDLQRAWLPSLLISMKPEVMGYDDLSPEEKSNLTRKLRTKFLENDLPRFMNYFTQALNASSNSFLCGSKPTIADCKALPLFRYYTRGIAEFIPKDCLSSYPAITAYIDRMLAIPEINKWYATKE